MPRVYTRLALLLTWILFAVGMANEARADAPDEGTATSVTTAAEAAADANIGDAPRIESEALRRPEVPDGYNVYDGGWIVFAYPPSVRQRVEPLIAEANTIRDELTERFNRPVLESVDVRIARTPGEMATLAPPNAPFPKYAAGVAYSRIGLVLLTLQAQYPGAHHDLVEIFHHELAHVALDEVVAGHHVPRWFNEGFAIHLSGESSIARLQTLWTATLGGNLLRLEELDRAFPAQSHEVTVAYAQSADVVRYLLRKHEQQRFKVLLDRLREGKSFNGALESSYGIDVHALEYEWREDAERRFSFWPVLLSGSMVWVGALGLFVLAWRRRRQKQKATLERWTLEEQAELAKRQGQVLTQGGRVRILLGPGTDDPPTARPETLHPRQESVIPKVEHDGDWHTLH